MIYAVSLGVQKKLIDKYCFDKCGKILVGGLIIKGGSFLPCKEKKCPYLDKEVLLMNAKTTTGEKVTIRKLQEEKTK